MPPVLPWLGLAWAALGAPQDVEADVRRSARPTVRVGRLAAGEAPPRIDGAVEEAVWERAGRLGPLTQVEPVAGAAPSRPTEVLLLRDEETLYIALRCAEDPALVRATQRARDAVLDPDDRVEFLLDTFHDQRSAFWFQIGPAGSRGDARITRNGAEFEKDFDFRWWGRARTTTEGWEAEIAIPAASLDFDPVSETWGLNVRRFLRSRNEEARWAAAHPAVRFFSIADAGVLAGMHGMSQGLGLDLVPFGVLEWSDDADSSGELDPDAGLDLFWRMGPNAKLALSLNTDFAEAEVDEQVVNLTRFPLFFPEKRDFFLEDAGHFFFGNSSQTDVIPFFSRRIGLDEEGREVPIDLAAKLTGQAGGFTYGLLGARTGDTSDLDEEELLVARASMHVLEQSDVGAIVTAGDPEGGDREATYGADANFRTGSFLGDRNLELSAWVLRAETEGVGGDDLAYRAQIDYPNDEVVVRASTTVVEEDFDPALGFVRRRDAVLYEGEARWRPRLHSSIRRLDFRLAPEIVTDTGGDTESVDVQVRPLGVEWESGDEVRVDVAQRREVLDEAFEIHDGVVIEPAGFTWQRYGLTVETSDHRPLSTEVSWTTGGFFGGDNDAFEVELAWRPGPFANFDLEYERNDVRLPEGDFVANAARLRARFLFTPDVGWSNLLQYDDVTDGVGLNSRLRWILSPGRELNLVLNQAWDAESGLDPTSTQAIAKIAYTIRP